MVNCKDKIKYLLYKAGLRNTIPAAVVNNVKIEDKNEPLVNIRNNSNFFFGKKLLAQEKILVRQSVAIRLEKASSLLPKNIKFKIYSAYRDKSTQMEMWQKRWRINRSKYPNLTEEEIENMTRGQIANPTNGFGGHQTGGAIDIGLCDAQGRDLDMGTNISEHNSKTRTSASDLTDEQRNNRRLLHSVMEKQGFKNYPAEWWHFSYGDRMWAAYSNQQQCFYGAVREKG